MAHQHILVPDNGRPWIGLHVMAP